MVEGAKDGSLKKLIGNDEETRGWGRVFKRIAKQLRKTAKRLKKMDEEKKKRGKKMLERAEATCRAGIKDCKRALDEVMAQSNKLRDFGMLMTRLDREYEKGTREGTTEHYWCNEYCIDHDGDGPEGLECFTIMSSGWSTQGPPEKITRCSQIAK